MPRELFDRFGGRVGLFHTQPADKLLDAADLVLAVGYNPIEYEPGLWNRDKNRDLIHVDVLPADIDKDYRPQLELTGNIAATIEQRVNEEIGVDRLIEVSFLSRGEALADEDLIRTKTNLVPEHVREVRVVDIVGLDRQADGGTHVRSTAEVGRVRVVKTESKGKGNKRVRIVVE